MICRINSNLFRLFSFTILLLSAIFVQAQNTNYGSNSGTGGTDNSYFGAFAGGLNSSGTTRNTFIGGGSGLYNSGNYNFFGGWRSGYNSGNGSHNVFLGSNSGNSADGSNNTFIGYASGYKNDGNGNLFAGMDAGYNGTTGSNNVFLGFRSGYLATGSSNVFLGNQAGFNETGSNLLYIDNSSTASPLIWGDFASDIVNINGKLGIGTTSPSYHFHAIGNDRARFQQSNGIMDLVAYGSGSQGFANSSGLFSTNTSALVMSGLTGSGDIKFVTRPTSANYLQRMIIKNGGNVGIATDDPLNKLQVGANPSSWNGNDLVLGNSNGALAIHNANTNTYLYGTQDISLRPGGQLALYTKSDGKVGIGTDDPNYHFHVIGSDRARFQQTNGTIDLVAYGPGSQDYANTAGLFTTGSSTLIMNGLTGSGDIQFVTRPSDYEQQMVIKSDGKVGIGTQNPTHGLDVNNTAVFRNSTYFRDNVAYAWESATDQYLHFKTTGGKGFVGMNSGNDLILQTNGGNIGIGTDNPLNKLQIGANPFSWNGNDLVLGNSNGALAIHNTSTNTYLYGTQDISIRPGTQLALYAQSNGNVGIGTDTPGEKLDIAGNIRASGTISASGYNPSDWNAAFGWGDHASEGYWKEGSNVSVQNITSNAQGTTTMGASSTAGFEFISTLPMFYFNKPLRVDGGLIGSHDEDLKLQTSGQTKITISNTNNEVTVDSNLILNGELTLNPTSGIPNDDNYEDLLVVNGDGEIATRTVSSIESPWLLQPLFDDVANLICDPDFFGNTVIEVFDLNGNIRIGDASYIDDDMDAGDDGAGHNIPDDWIKFTEEGYLGFKSADATRGMLLFDDDTQSQYLNLFHSGGTSSFSNGSNDYFLQSSGRDVAFGGSVTIPNLAADRLEANDNMVFNFDRLHDAGADHFQIERGGAGGLGLPVPLFRVEDTGNTSVLAGNFTISGGHAFLGASPVEDPSLTQVIVRDPAAGQLKFRNANSFTPWTNNSTYLSYTGKIGINTSSEPVTDLEVNGSGKFNSLEVVGKGNASQWNTAYTNRVNPGAGLTWNSSSKDLSVKVGSGISINASDELELDQSAISITGAQVTGLPWDTSGGSLTYNGPQLGIGDKALDEVLVISNGTIKTVSGSEFTSGGNTPWQIGTGRLDYAGTVDVDGALESTSFNTGAGTFSSVETSTLKISGLISGSTFDRVLMEDGSGNLGYKDLSSFNFSHWDKDASDNLKYEAGTITSTKGIYSEVNSSDLAFVVKSGTTTNFRVDGAGNIRARKLELDLQPSWPDYVFNKDYELRTLEEVETFVKANNHLPDVPSEKEVKENGIDVAEMESVLLRKIEELTLYIIDQNKTIKSQQEKLSEQSQELSAQQQELKQQKDDFAARLEALEQKIGQ